MPTEPAGFGRYIAPLAQLTGQLDFGPHAAVFVASGPMHVACALRGSRHTPRSAIANLSGSPPPMRPNAARFGRVGHIDRERWARARPVEGVVALMARGEVSRP
jgi:hypothetical protein